MEFSTRLHAVNSQPRSYVERVRTLAEGKREHISEVMEMTNGLIAAKRAVPQKL